MSIYGNPAIITVLLSTLGRSKLPSHKEHGISRVHKRDECTTDIGKLLVTASDREPERPTRARLLEDLTLYLPKNG